MIDFLGRRPQIAVLQRLKSRTGITLFFVVLGLNLCINGLLAFTLIESRQTREREIRDEVESLALLLDHNVSETGAKIDLSLRVIVANLERELRLRGRLDDDEINAMLRDHQSFLPTMSTFHVTDASGMVRYGDGIRPGQSFDYSDRDFFLAQRQAADTGLFVSKPVLGRVVKYWVVPFSRRYNHPDGSFAGVVTGGVPVEYLGGLLSGLNLGPHGSASIRDADLGQVARLRARDDPGEQIGSKTVSRELREIVASGASRATYHSDNAGEGVERILAYRRLSSLPFNVLVGMGTQDYLEVWYHSVGKAGALSVFSLVTSALGALVLWRSIRATEVTGERNRFLLQQASDGVHIIDARGVIFEVSDIFCAERGYTREEMIGRNIAEFDVVHTASDVEKNVAKMIAEGGKSMLETRHRSKDGRLFDVEVMCSPARIFSGDALYCSARDISARKTAEAELRWLNEAVRQSTAAIVVADMSQQVLYANPAYERLFGYSLAELRNRTLSLLLPDDPVLRDANPVELGSFEGEKLRRTKDGRIIPVLLKTAPIFDAAGTAIGSVSAKTDLTYLKAAEMRAEAANRAKSEFLATMSHEIRTPLNGIIGLVHLALMDDLAPRHRDYIEGIDQSAKRLLGIVNDILDLSKIEARQMTLEQVPFSPRRLVDDSVAVVGPAAAKKGLQISTRVAPAVPPELMGDPLRIGQVLLNFLNNAVKFTEHGGIAVDVDAEHREGQGTLLKVVVSDTGIGLSAEQLAGLFQPFQQGDASITRKFGGTGLGLAIARQLAGLMGGDVGVESTVGQGSSFWFTVPASTSAGVVADPASGEALPVITSADHAILRGTRVLLAEDDPTNQMVAVALLEAAGMEVDVVGDGEAAVEKAGAKSYEIVLMDLRMPGMDGLTATRLLRQNDSLADLPVIALTADAMRSRQEECMAAGMNDFLSKPFEPGQLYAVIYKWVTGLADVPMFGPVAAELHNDGIVLPSGIAGLDIRAGLRQVAGLKRLYIQSLASFLQHGDALAKVREALGAQDIERASRAAHTLKGSAGMVAAGDIYRHAGELEAALLAEDMARAAGLMDSLDVELAATQEAIRSALAALQPGQPVAEPVAAL